MIPTRPAALAFPLLLLAGAAARAEDAAPLRGEAAWQTLVGNTVVARTKSGASYTDFYGADGAIRHRDGDGVTAGHWSREGDRTCFDYPDDDESFCVAVTVTGSSGSFTDADGAQDTFDILPGNAKGL